jgi:hypothetical protein
MGRSLLPHMRTPFLAPNPAPLTHTQPQRVQAWRGSAPDTCGSLRSAGTSATWLSGVRHPIECMSWQQRVQNAAHPPGFGRCAQRRTSPAGTQVPASAPISASCFKGPPWRPLNTGRYVAWHGACAAQLRSAHAQKCGSRAHLVMLAAWCAAFLLFPRSRRHCPVIHCPQRAFKRSGGCRLACCGRKWACVTAWLGFTRRACLRVPALACRMRAGRHSLHLAPAHRACAPEAAEQCAGACDTAGGR